MIRLENSIYLYGLLALPVMVLLFLLLLRWKKKALQRFANPALHTTLFPDASRNKQIIRFLLLLLAAACLVIGIANPQIGSKLEEVHRKGVDILVALDISNSMKAADIQPSRIDRAKQSISRFVDKLQNDRIGIVVFAGNAYVQLPLTTDYGAAKMFSSVIDCEMIPTQGTAIGAAIEMANRSFKEEDKKHKTLIIITDGENHEDDAVGEAKKAHELGVIIHTVGMGSVNGAPIPDPRSGGFRKDNAGNTVISKLDEDLLQQIASAGGGRFVRANNGNDGLESLLNDIGKMEKKDFGMKVYTDYDDQFQYFLAAALLFLLAELFVPEKKSKWWSRINLFRTDTKTAA